MTLEYLRSFRVFEYAIFDLSLAFLGIALLSPILIKLAEKCKLKTTLKTWMLLTLPISILSHIAAQNFTPMTEHFLDPNSHYTLKILIIALLILGLKDIKKINL